MLALLSLVAVLAAAAHGAPSRLNEHVRAYERVQFVAADIFADTRGRRNLQHAESFELHVPAFGRNYHLTLSRNLKMFTASAKFYHVDEHGERTAVDMSHMAYYNGQVANTDESSFAHIQINTNGEVSGSFHYGDLANQTFKIAPASRHLESTDPSEHVIYRDSDYESTINDVEPFCKRTMTKDVLSEEEFQAAAEAGTRQHSRSRRDPYDVNRPICDIGLVADSKYFVDIGGSSLSASFNAMAEDFEFSKIIFNGTFTISPQVDFQIGRMDVFTSAGTDPLLMTCPAAGCNGITYLNAVAALDFFGELCLGHAFTNYEFANSLLGLAFVGSAQANQPGGICQARSGGKSSNTGFSTRSSQGRLQDKQARLVTTHELGHNFGANHDPLTVSGPQHIMYEFAVPGTEASHETFSTQSINEIRATVNAKGGCFVEDTGDVCGNAIQQGAEECDCGGASSCQAVDSCCNTPIGDGAVDCKVKAGNQCSPRHLTQGICCGSNCMFTTDECVAATDCAAAATCDGAGTCPDTVKAVIDTRCGGDPSNPNDTPGGSPAQEVLQSKLCDGAGSCSRSICTTFTGSAECDLAVGATACLIACTDPDDGNTCKAFASVTATGALTMDYTLAYKKAPGDSCTFNTGQPLSGYCDDQGVCQPNDAEQTLQDQVTELINDFFDSEFAQNAKRWALDSSYGVKNYVWLIIGFIFFFALLAACGCFRGKRSGANRGPRARGPKRRGPPPAGKQQKQGNWQEMQRRV